MIKGCAPGVVKRVITLRKSLRQAASRTHLEEVDLKFIDTSSKMGHGRYQTKQEKNKFLGTLKKDLRESTVWKKKDDEWR